MHADTLPGSLLTKLINIIFIQKMAKYMHRQSAWLSPSFPMFLSPLSIHMLLPSTLGHFVQNVAFKHYCLLYVLSFIMRNTKCVCVCVRACVCSCMHACVTPRA